MIAGTVRIVNANIAEYLVPVNADVEDIKVYLRRRAGRDSNPLGVKGVGEVGIVGVPGRRSPSAVYHATGKRTHQLPHHADKLRVKVPSGVKLMPHRHPEDRILHRHVRSLLYRPRRTVRWRQSEGLSARQRHRSARRHLALPLGQVRRVRPQVTAIGPLGLEYLNPHDDPRRQGR